MPTGRTHFLVTYRDPESDEVLTVRARTVTDSSLGLSFIAVSEFLFDDGSPLVNPKTEVLRTRLKDVRTLHLSIYRVQSIAEVGTDHEGLAFDRDRSNLVVFPSGHDA